MSNSNLTTRKRILIGIPTIIITGGILILCWFLLPGNVFHFLLIGLIILFSVIEILVRKYENKRTGDPQNLKQMPKWDRLRRG
jgi:hypothetical protein